MTNPAPAMRSNIGAATGENGPESRSFIALNHHLAGLLRRARFLLQLLGNFLCGFLYLLECSAFTGTADVGNFLPDITLISGQLIGHTGKLQ